MLSKLANKLVPAVVAIVFVQGCGGDSTAPPAATKLSLTTPPSITAQSRIAFPTQPVVQLEDANGNAVAQAGTAITASITAGGGTATGTTTQTTGSTGAATFSSLSISGTGGTQTITFSAPSLESVSTTVTLTAGTASTLTVNAGANQTAQVGAPVPVLPSVKVTDADGNVVSGTTVTFLAATGGGSVSGGTTISGADGVATVGGWTLGTTSGTNSLTATAVGLAPATISATALPGPAASLAIQSGNNLATYPGRALSVPPSVIVRDGYGNVVPGATVQFAVTGGGGSVSAASVATNGSGVASTSWTLESPFTNTLQATVAGVSSVSFNATGLIPLLSVSLASSGISIGGTTQATAVLTDNTGNAITGRTVTWGSSEPGLATLSAAGLVTGIGSGSACVTATVDGASRCANITVGGSTPKQPASSLTVAVASTTLRVGETTQATATLRDPNGNVVSGRTIIWGSHNPGGATVSATGLITALSADNTTISATVDGVNAMTFFTIVP
jgi:Bacterial Ig-like domain (group 2)